MKKISVNCWICGILAVLSLVLNFKAIFGNGQVLFGLTFVSTVFFGRVGSIITVLATVAWFVCLFIFGRKVLSGTDIFAVQRAFIGGGCMALLAFVSAVTGIIFHRVIVGEIIIMLFSAYYTLCIFIGRNKV